MEQDKPEKKILRAVEGLIDEDRVINFSDAVFAFAATLLVLKIDLPIISQNDLSSPRLIGLLMTLAPQYFANIISFLIIAYYWLTHHAIFSLVHGFNQMIIWLNIIFLIFLSFIPFPVDLFGDYNNSIIVIIFYSVSLAVVEFLLASIWIYAASNKRLTEPNMSRKLINYYTCRFLLAPVVFTLSVPLVFIDTTLAKISWLFVFIGIIFINKIFNFNKISAIEKESI